MKTHFLLFFWLPIFLGAPLFLSAQSIDKTANDQLLLSQLAGTWRNQEGEVLRLQAVSGKLGVSWQYGGEQPFKGLAVMQASGAFWEAQVPNPFDASVKESRSLSLIHPGVLEFIPKGVSPIPIFDYQQYLFVKDGFGFPKNQLPEKRPAVFSKVSKTGNAFQGLTITSDDQLTLTSKHPSSPHVKKLSANFMMDGPLLIPFSSQHDVEYQGMQAANGQFMLKKAGESWTPWLRLDDPARSGCVACGIWFRQANTRNDNSIVEFLKLLGNGYGVLMEVKRIDQQPRLTSYGSLSYPFTAAGFVAGKEFPVQIVPKIPLNYAEPAYLFHQGKAYFLPKLTDWPAAQWEGPYDYSTPLRPSGIQEVEDTFSSSPPEEDDGPEVISEEPDVNGFIVVSEEPEPLNMPEVRMIIGYPDEARDKNIQGQVVVRILVDEKGNYVKHVMIKSVHPSLDNAVVANLHKLKFSPAKRGEKPVKFWVNVPFRFKLMN